MLKSIIIDSLYQPIPGFHIHENKKMTIYPDVGLLNHMVILFLLFFRNLHIVCHSCWTLIDIPPTMYKGSNFSTALPIFFIFWLFNNRHSNRFNTINTHRNQLKKKLKQKTWNCKSPRTKHREKVSGHWSWQWFLGYITKSTGNKSKNRQMGLHHTKKFCLAKNNQVNENTTYRMKEDIWNHISGKG